MNQGSENIPFNKQTGPKGNRRIFYRDKVFISKRKERIVSGKVTWSPFLWGEEGQGSYPADYLLISMHQGNSRLIGLNLCS